MAKIGVVDDRGSVVNEFVKLFRLEDVGCKVVPCKTVDSALEALDSDKDWDFWVVDLMMPRGDNLSANDAQDNLSTGIEFIRQLELKKVSVKRQIIIFSARSVTDDELAGFKHKPVVLPKSDNTILDVVLHIKKALPRAA